MCMLLYVCIDVYTSLHSVFENPFLWFICLSFASPESVGNKLMKVLFILYGIFMVALPFHVAARNDHSR